VVGCRFQFALDGSPISRRRTVQSPRHQGSPLALWPGVRLPSRCVDQIIRLRPDLRLEHARLGAGTRLMAGPPAPPTVESGFSCDEVGAGVHRQAVNPTPHRNVLPASRTSDAVSRIETGFMVEGTVDRQPDIPHKQTGASAQATKPRICHSHSSGQPMNASSARSAGFSWRSRSACRWPRHPNPPLTEDRVGAALQPYPLYRSRRIHVAGTVAAALQIRSGSG
jgi:hypothetical protein